MAATHEDRNANLSPGVAIKAPCRVATTAAITLSGEQTIDGVACVAGNRVLVKNQTNAVDNGIWGVSTGAWSREPDFDGNRDVVKGTFVFITDGTVNAGGFYECTTTGTVVFGTSNITFAVGALGPIALPLNLSNTTFTQAGTGATARTGLDKTRDIVSVKDFNAVGDGVTDDTAAIQAAVDACKVNGPRLGVPFGVYNYTALNLDGIVQGLHILGESDPSGATNFAKCATLRCTSSGAGIGISIKSSYGVTLENLALTYNNVGYTGDLVRTGHSALATDSAFITLHRCVLTGEGAAVGANSLFFTDASIIERVHKCTFKNAVAGIRSGTSYTNVLTVEDSTFQALTSFNVKFDGTTSCQSIYFKGNTFEQLTSGKASGFDMGTTAYIEGLTFIGNWFGDVTVNGGLYFIHAKALGMSVAGNYFATAGAGAGDYAIQLDGCQGVSIVGGNRFDAKAVNIATACLGVVIVGNDLVVGATAITVGAGSIPTVFANNGFSDTFGGIVTVAGVAAPQVLFNPVSGATKQAQIQQSANVLNINDNGVANRMSIDIATGNTTISGTFVKADARLDQTTTAYTNNAAAQTATMTNGPTAGNPTKWIPINDNGTIRNVPAW